MCFTTASIRIVASIAAKLEGDGDDKEDDDDDDGGQ